VHVRWLTAFLDFPAAEFGSEVTFWRAISGSTVSPPRGPSKEFASLDPFNGDAHLRVQRIAAGPGGTHLDMHVDDPASAALEAVALGAREIADYGTHRVMASPAGGRFCLVEWAGENRRSRPIRWPGGTISIIDQICYDVPAAKFDAELAFWTALTGQDAPGDVDRHTLTRDPDLSLQVLLVRSDNASGATYLDVAASNLPVEVERHEDWGATVVERRHDQVVMADPTGRRYFISARNPRTGA
jgi:hypothetical protein